MLVKNKLWINPDCGENVWSDVFLLRQICFEDHEFLVMSNHYPNKTGRKNWAKVDIQ